MTARRNYLAPSSTGGKNLCCVIIVSLGCFAALAEDAAFAETPLEGAVLIDFEVRLLGDPTKQRPATRRRPRQRDAMSSSEEPSNDENTGMIATFRVRTRPDWAPVGAARFKELVEARHFDGAGFFRVLRNFVAQFGIAANATRQAVWRKKTIPDETIPRTKRGSNHRGTVSFAHAGPGTRATQLFINLADNFRLDEDFPPVAEVLSPGMDVVDRIRHTGEGGPKGPGPSQGKLQREGDAYLQKEFPWVTRVETARLVTVGVGAGHSSSSERRRHADTLLDPDVTTDALLPPPVRRGGVSAAASSSSSRASDDATSASSKEEEEEKEEETGDPRAPGAPVKAVGGLPAARRDGVPQPSSPLRIVVCVVGAGALAIVFVTCSYWWLRSTGVGTEAPHVGPFGGDPSLLDVESSLAVPISVHKEN